MLAFWISKLLATFALKLFDDLGGSNESESLKKGIRCESGAVPAAVSFGLMMDDYDWRLLQIFNHKS